MSKLRVVAQPEIEILDLQLFFAETQTLEVNEDIRGPTMISLLAYILTYLLSCVAVFHSRKLVVVTR